jgi:hypothetical protein
MEKQVPLLAQSSDLWVFYTDYEEASHFTIKNTSGRLILLNRFTCDLTIEDAGVPRLLSMTLFDAQMTRLCSVWDDATIPINSLLQLSIMRQAMRTSIPEARNIIMPEGMFIPMDGYITFAISAAESADEWALVRLEAIML